MGRGRADRTRFVPGSYCTVRWPGLRTNRNGWKDGTCALQRQDYRQLQQRRPGTRSLRAHISSDTRGWGLAGMRSTLRNLWGTLATPENIWAFVLFLIAIALIVFTTDSSPVWIYQGF